MGRLWITWEGCVVPGATEGMFDFWRLPWTMPLHLQVDKGADMGWFREGRPEGGLEGACPGQAKAGTRPCERPGLG